MQSNEKDKYVWFQSCLIDGAPKSQLLSIELLFALVLLPSTVYINQVTTSCQMASISLIGSDLRFWCAYVLFAKLELSLLRCH